MREILAAADAGGGAGAADPNHRRPGRLPGVRGGGVANAIIGSGILVAIAMTVAVPVGIGAG